MVIAAIQNAATAVNNNVITPVRNYAAAHPTATKVVGTVAAAGTIYYFGLLDLNKPGRWFGSERTMLGKGVDLIKSAGSAVMNNKVKTAVTVASLAAVVKARGYIGGAIDRVGDGLKWVAATRIFQ